LQAQRFVDIRGELGSFGAEEWGVGRAMAGERIWVRLGRIRAARPVGIWVRLARRFPDATGLGSFGIFACGKLRTLKSWNASAAPTWRHGRDGRPIGAIETEFGELGIWLSYPFQDCMGETRVRNRMATSDGK
jgi:hypothetical protein